jgi:hypothetical protein
VLGEDVTEAVAAGGERVVEAAVPLPRDREHVADAVGRDDVQDVLGGVQEYPASVLG